MCWSFNLKSPHVRGFFMHTIIGHHIFLIILGIILFFTVNFIGKYSKGFGYSEIKFDIHSDELVGFNFVLRMLTPVVFTILISSSLYYFKWDFLVKDIYLLVVYSFIFRVIWNLAHNRTLLINWYTQIAYAFLAIGMTYLAYKHKKIKKTPLFPDLETIANELWIIIFLFLYKIFNEIKFEPKFKKKRVNSYIENRLSKFKDTYETLIDERIDKEMHSFKEKANSFLQDKNNLEDYKFQRHALLNSFDTLFKSFIKDIIFSIMTNEDFNRPFIFRKIENLICKITHRNCTQGVMQFSSRVPLSDEESVKLAIHKIFEDAYNCFIEEDVYLSESQLVIHIGRNYNPCDDYISAVEDIYQIIKNEKSDELQIFINDHTLIGLDPSFNLE